MKKLLITALWLVLIIMVNAQIPSQQPYTVEPPPNPNITKVEVAIGITDPGIGNGTVLNIPTPDVELTLPTTINFSGLTAGSKNIYVRSRDALGRWSLTNIKLLQVGNFYDYALPANDAPNITKVEVAIGITDPGIGFGTALNIPTPEVDLTLPTTINFGGLTAGSKNIYIRSRDVLGRWSLSNIKLLQVGNFYDYAFPANDAPNITKVEVAIGTTDPGFGNGTALNLPTPDVDLTLPTTINFGGLTAGSKNVFIRSRDVLGRWSLSNIKLLQVGNFYDYAFPVNDAPNIIKTEYYVGTTDPNFGNGTLLPLPTGTDVSTGLINVVIPVLPDGNQTFYTRSRDALGRWSLTNFKQFRVGLPSYSPPASTAPLLANLEYYIDNDPGFGNGTAITFAAGTDVQLTNIPVSLAASLSVGTHIFHIRSKQNPWSLDNAASFDVGPALTLNWTGNVSTTWENPANWGEGIVPTATSIVIIPIGKIRYPIVNVNTSIKSLKLEHSTSVIVKTGIAFQIK